MTYHPDELIHFGRFDWERVIRRAPLPLATKAIAYTLAQYGNKNGTSIHPGNHKLTQVCGVDEKTVRRHLTALRAGGYLLRLQEDDWRRRVAQGIADEYELTCPPDFNDLPGVLDPKEAR